MPRRKTRDEDALEAPPLMLPAPAPARTGNKHEHELDPYAVPAGAVPGKVSNLRTDSGPLTRKATTKELAERDDRKAEQKALGKRYNRYLDALTEHGGDKVKAVADATGLAIEEVRENLADLHADICRGIGHTDLGDILLENDLGIHARVGILRGWAYSDNAAASLNSMKLIQELDGIQKDVGSFEQFLRISKEQERMQGVKK